MTSGYHPPVALEVRQLEVVYQKVITAVQGISLTVNEGEISAIIGTNGAGKTTTLRAVSGFLRSEDVRVTDGEVIYFGEPLQRRPPHVNARAGLILVPERDKVFETLTVEENLRFNMSRTSRLGFALEHVYGYFPPLAERRRTTTGYLSGGEKQMLAIGMALLNDPRLLLVDELSLGLAPKVVSGLMTGLRALNRDHGLTILLVEQNAMAALEIAAHGYVMENGRIVFSGTAEELLRHKDIREFYLGGGEREAGRTYLDVKQYSRKRRWWG